MSDSPTLLWFRQDLRLRDNAALQAAMERGAAIVPVYVFDETGEELGGASRSWLHHSLTALDGRLRERGSRLVVKQGESLAVLKEMVAATKAAAVFWNRCYEPAAIARDTKVKLELRAAGIEATSFNSALLFEPHTVAN